MAGVSRKSGLKVACSFAAKSGECFPEMIMHPIVIKTHIVDANFHLFGLGRLCTYKTINTLGQGQKPHTPTMNGGGFGRRTSDAKVRIIEKKCLEYFCQRIGIRFCEKMG